MKHVDSHALTALHTKEKKFVPNLFPFPFFLIRSGDIVPPINFNGFVAKLEFVDEAAQEAERQQNNQYGELLPRGDSSDSHGYLEDHHDAHLPQTPDQGETYDENDYDEDYEHDYEEGVDHDLGEGPEDQDDDYDEDYVDDEDGEETSIHHHQVSETKQDHTSAQSESIDNETKGTFFDELFLGCHVQSAFGSICRALGRNRNIRQGICNVGKGMDRRRREQVQSHYFTDPQSDRI